MTHDNESIRSQEGYLSTKGQEEDPGSVAGNSGVASQILEQQTDLTVSMRELIPILKEVLEMQEAESSDKITQRISDKYDAQIGMMEQRLDEIAEMKQPELKSALEVKVEEAVEAFMTTMLDPGSSYGRDMRIFVSKIVGEHATRELGSLLSTIDILPKSDTGPGEVGSGGKPARLSATIRQETYDRIKSLGAVFSHHIQAACELYLKALDGTQNDTHPGE